MVQVVPGDDDPCTLGQLGDRVAQVAEPFGGHQGLVGAGAGVLEVGGQALAVHRQRVEAEDGGPIGPLAHGSHLRLGQSAGGGELGVGRRPAQRRGELLGDRAEGPGPRPHRSGGPVALTHLVDHRPADAGGREPGERDAERRVEAAGRLDQGQCTGTDQVVGVQVAWQACRGLASQVTDQGQVSGHQLLDGGQGGGHERVIGSDAAGLSPQHAGRRNADRVNHPDGARPRPLNTSVRPLPCRQDIRRTLSALERP